MTAIQIALESFFAAVAAGAFFIWFYNRYLSSLRESYWKKASSLATLPAAAIAGIGHGTAIWNDWPVFRPIALVGLLICVYHAYLLRNRLRENSRIVKTGLPLDAPGVDYPYYSLPVSLGLRSIGLLNDVNKLELVCIDQKIRGLHADLNGLRLIFLTDFHVHPTLSEKYFRSVIDRALDRIPDVLLIGGDFISKRPYAGKARRVLERLGTHSRIVAVRGNHDFWTRPGYFGRLLESWNAELLTNRIAWIERGAARLAIVGLESPYIPLTQRRREALLEELGDAPSIGLVHTPEVFPQAAALGCQFCLAGHTHGGQIRLPFFGTTVAACAAPAHLVYGAGRIGPMQTFVSNGIGAFYPVRFLCPPQIVEVTVYSY